MICLQGDLCYLILSDIADVQLSCCSPARPTNLSLCAYSRSSAPQSQHTQACNSLKLNTLMVFPRIQHPLIISIMQVAIFTATVRPQDVAPDYRSSVSASKI